MQMQSVSWEDPRVIYGMKRRKDLIAEMKACSISGNIERGRGVHQAAIRFGDDSSVYVASTLVSMYSGFGRMEEARAAFECVDSPDVACWTALILGYADNGNSALALELLFRMYREGCTPDARIYVAALKACADIAATEPGGSMKNRGKMLHLLAASTGNDNVFVKAILVHLYATCRCMQEARIVYDRMKNPDVVSQSALILGYADNGESELALELFSRSSASNARTLVAALKACTDLVVKDRKVARERGKALHLLASKAGWDLDVYVLGTVVDMYAKCGFMREARIAFDSMKTQDVVCWNAFILGYVENGNSDVALDMFSRMGRECFDPEARTFVAILKVCTEQVDVKVSLERGKVLHMLASSGGCDSDVYVQGTLVDMYAKCGCIEVARKVFEHIKRKDVVCWNTIIVGHVDNGLGYAALHFYLRMKREGCSPDAVTFSAALKASYLIGSLETGRKIHEEICNLDLQQVMSNVLVDFYARCGSLNEATSVFDSYADRTLTTWNSLMTGYSGVGDTEGVFDLFEKMQRSGVIPDGITFNCILTTCSQAGLVERGLEYFRLMSSRYGILPRIEHYNGIIDMLGRGNKLDKAMEFLRGMSVTPTRVVWTTVLSACRKWKNAELGKLAFESLTCIDVKNPRAYLLMANVHNQE